MSEILFDHVAIAVPRLREALPFVVGELGGRPWGRGEAGDFRWRQYGFAGGGRLELIEPKGPAGGFLRRFLERHGAGVHHVTFKVDALGRLAQRAEDHGFRVVGYDDSRADWKEAFLHPRSAMGIVVQLVESSEKPRPQEPAQDDPPPGPPGVALVGLRLAVVDLERAECLWSALLGGSRNGRGATVAEWRWARSPLRIVVETTTEQEGPLAIELECLRPAVIPRGAHPELGTRFLPVDPTSGLAGLRGGGDAGERGDVFYLEED